MEVAFNNKKMLAKFNYVLNTYHELCEKHNLDLSYNSTWISNLNLDHSTMSSDEIQSLISEKSLREDYLPRWKEHIGFPEHGRVVEIQQLGESLCEDFDNFWQYAKYELPPEIGTASSALLVDYPEDGLTGWHTNWNANAYQILFTWSETGEGFFTYYDVPTDKVVVIKDKPGWQCRWYYFGRKDEPEHHCWHACYTKCRRMTLAFKFSNGGKTSWKDSSAQFLRDELVAEIESYE